MNPLIKFQTNIPMKKALVISSFLLLNLICKAQNANPPNSSTWLEDTNGKNIVSKNSIDVDGNPYFPKQWISGTITLITGKVIPYNELRYNTLSKSLEFQLSDKAYNVINPINEFTLGSMVFKNGFKPIDEQDMESFYQVLYDGKQKLLCNRISNIYIEQPYNSATKTKKLDLVEKYYLQKNDGKLYEVKKNLKFLLAILEDNNKILEEFCKKENIRLKSWDDATKVLAYADSLEK